MNISSEKSIPILTIAKKLKKDFLYFNKKLKFYIEQYIQKKKELSFQV